MADAHVDKQVSPGEKFSSQTREDLSWWVNGSKRRKRKVEAFKPKNNVLAPNQCGGGTIMLQGCSGSDSIDIA